MVKKLKIRVTKKMCEMNAAGLVNCKDEKFQNILLYSLYA